MSQDQKTSEWAMGLHLSQLVGYVVPIPFAGVLTPLILWLVVRRERPGLDPHGKNAMNWIISSTIYSTLAFITVIGIPLVFVLWGCNVVFPIIAAIKARNGVVWSYPLSINFVGNNADKSLRRVSMGLLSFCLLPLAGVIGTSVWVNRQGQWLSGLSRTQGTVVEIRETTDSDGDTVYKPVLKYQDSTGESYRMSPLWTSNPSAYRVGETVDVLYEPNLPRKAVIDNWFEKWGLSVGLLVLCGIFLFLSLIPSLSTFVLSFWM